MFTVEASSTTPIYRQIIDQVRRLAASGQLSPDDRMPSVRELAASLAVNPNTVSKAYGLLEYEGLLLRERGLGMVVAKRRAAPDTLLAPTLQQLTREARELGLSKTDLLRLVREHWEDQP